MILSGVHVYFEAVIRSLPGRRRAEGLPGPPDDGLALAAVCYVCEPGSCCIDPKDRP